jgi:MFS family permease
MISSPAAMAIFLGVMEGVLLVSGVLIGMRLVPFLDKRMGRWLSLPVAVICGFLFTLGPMFIVGELAEKAGLQRTPAADYIDYAAWIIILPFFLRLAIWAYKRRCK